MGYKEFDNELLNLEILAEEAAEVCRIKSKIVRFGFESYHPKNKLPNREKLEQEIGHFMAMVDILVENGSISAEGIRAGRAQKLEKLPKWYSRLEESGK